MAGDGRQEGHDVHLMAVPDLRIEHDEHAEVVDVTDDKMSLWHVRVTLAGSPTDAKLLGDALRSLCEANPFLASVRYSSDRAEVTYWDEAENADDAAALALRVWNDHRRRLGLPAWEVVGLEVVDRDTRAVRGDAGVGPSAIGDVRPF